MSGFTHPKNGKRFLLIGSHTSVVREGGRPFVKPGCAGCAAQRIEARQGGDGETVRLPVSPHGTSIAVGPDDDPSPHP